tara:strand:+ start:17461 stop:18201 length:741 start_codon:yes stop_codon:yes gene_type:complete
MQTNNKDQIILNVTNKYSSLAKSAESCCGDGYANNSVDYDSRDLLTLIPTVTDVSAGCGNPLSIKPINSGETVVDFGSGGGIDCFLAAQQTGPLGKVFGIDMTPAMIELANNNKNKLRVNNVEFIESQIDNTTLPSDSVDVILSNCVINLVPNKPSVFREAYRILKENGRFQICDIVISAELPEEALTDSNWCSCLSGAMVKKDYMKSIHESGFRTVETVSERIYKPDAEEVWMGSVYSISILAIK